MAPGFSSTLALASSVPMALLGLWLLWLKPRRAEQVFFGAFAILWGVQVASANIGVVLDSAAVFRVGFLVSFAVIPPAYLFLAQFAARLEAGRWSWLLPAVAGAVAATAVIVLVASPELVLESVGSDGGSLGAVAQGPLAFPLFWIPFFAVFYLALGAVYLRYRAAPLGSAKHRYRGMLIALALYTSYQTVTNLAIFGLDPLARTSVSGTWGQRLASGLFLLGALFLVGLVAHLIARPAEPGQRDRGILAAFLVPAAVATVTEAAGLPSQANTWGLWRLLMVAVLVHTLARYRLFNLDVKLKPWIAPGLAGALLGLGGLASLVLVLGDGSLFAGSPTLAAGAVAGVLLASREQVGAAFFPDASEDPAYLAQRKREVYEAALERVVSEDGVDAAGEDPVLAELRESLGVPEAEHAALVFRFQDAPGGTGTIGPIQASETVAGRYHVDRLIGEGAHGRAFLAYDEEADREVVLKVVGRPLLGGEAAVRLVQEAEMLAGIDHPNVIGVHDVLEGRHEVVLVLEYADDGSLADRLSRRRLGLAEAVHVLEGILSGLEAAHDAGIVHRDIKPENVLLTSEDTVKLADFGVAQGASEGATALTAGPVGTLLYMSPEQVRSDPVDERTDLYAAGVVFHRALTGGFYLPVAGEDDFGIRRQILEGEPVLDLDGRPSWVRELLERALSKDPEDRFGSAAAMRAAIALPDAVEQVDPHP